MIVSVPDCDPGSPRLARSGSFGDRFEQDGRYYARLGSRHVSGLLVNSRGGRTAHDTGETIVEREREQFILRVIHCHSERGERWNYCISDD
jgi:hypothetical protein